MKLTRTERWTLSNQYRIQEQLAALRNDKDEVQYCKNAQDVLNRGYEWEYDRLAESVYEEKHTLTEAECQETVEILDMFYNIQYAYGQLGEKDKEGIADFMAKQFPGFDGNNEGKFMSYANYFCRVRDAFESLQRPKDFNSHAPLLPHYRRMLVEWKRCANPQELTKADLVKLTNMKAPGA